MQNMKISWPFTKSSRKIHPEMQTSFKIMNSVDSVVIILENKRKLTDHAVINMSTRNEVYPLGMTGANPERFASACRRAGSRRETLLSEANGEDLSSQVNARSTISARESIVTGISEFCASTEIKDPCFPIYAKHRQPGSYDQYKKALQL